MRLRVDSTSFEEYVSAAIIGRWLWKYASPEFNDDRPELVPEPPVSIVNRLGYSYIGMLVQANSKPFHVIYGKLIDGKLGADLVNNVKLPRVSKVAYIANRIGYAAVGHPAAPDPRLFGTIIVPRVEPYLDLVTPPEMVA